MRRHGRAHLKQVVADNVSRLMEHHDHMSHRRLAEKADVSQRAVSNLLSKEVDVLPNLHTVDLIAKFFGVPTWLLLVPELPMDVLTSPGIAEDFATFATLDKETRKSVRHLIGVRDEGKVVRFTSKP